MQDESSQPSSMVPGLSTRSILSVEKSIALNTPAGYQQAIDLIVNALANTGEFNPSLIATGRMVYDPKMVVDSPMMPTPPPMNVPEPPMSIPEPPMSVPEEIDRSLVIDLDM